MKTTVESGYWTEGRKSSQRELELQAQQVRAAINRVFSRKLTIVSTGSGIDEELWSDLAELGADVHANLTALVVASNGPGTVFGKFEHTALFLRPGTAPAVQLGATQPRHPDITAGGVTLTLGILANRLFVNGNDGGAAVTWDVWIEVRKA